MQQHLSAQVQHSLSALMLRCLVDQGVLEQAVPSLVVQDLWDSHKLARTPWATLLAPGFHPVEVRQA